MSTSPRVVVVGSGAGGGLTACLLAEAGLAVTLLEEGATLPLDEVQAYSTNEMRTKYRSGGVTAALGSPQVTYVEARTLGGGSEVNSALYHRIPEAVLEDWQTRYGFEFDREVLEAVYVMNEKELGVRLLPDGQISAASLKMQKGANILGWKCMEVPRWCSYEGNKATRNSVSQVFIPRARAAGAQVLSHHRVRHVKRNGTRWQVLGRNSSQAFAIEADFVFFCGGAIQTPTLLQRSGLAENTSRQLYLHPTLKLTAEFLDEVTNENSGVPSHQVKEFSPHLSFGCSISKPQFMSVGMLDHQEHLPYVMDHWRRHAVYYCMVNGASVGSVRAIPGMEQPLVKYRLLDADASVLFEGLEKLNRLLLAADAQKLYPTIGRSPFITSENQQYWRQTGSGLRSQMRLSTIHLMGSCPSGENKKNCAVNSRGQILGARGLYVNDASLMCTALGVNPQGAIMAMTRMNCMSFLKGLGR